MTGPRDHRDFLRHCVATLAYRGAKALRGGSMEVSRLQIDSSSRTAGEILAHIGDLLDWALWLAKGEHVWKETPAADWDADVRRFHESLAAFDAYLASGAPLGCPPERIFQGPIADALTHVGQIALLRRVGGQPVRGENYFKAHIEVGRVGASQAAPVREFD